MAGQGINYNFILATTVQIHIFRLFDSRDLLALKPNLSSDSYHFFCDFLHSGAESVLPSPTPILCPPFIHLLFLHSSSPAHTDPAPRPSLLSLPLLSCHVPLCLRCHPEEGAVTIVVMHGPAQSPGQRRKKRRHHHRHYCHHQPDEESQT